MLSKIDYVVLRSRKPFEFLDYVVRPHKIFFSFTQLEFLWHSACTSCLHSPWIFLLLALHYRAALLDSFRFSDSPFPNISGNMIDGKWSQRRHTYTYKWSESGWISDKHIEFPSVDFWAKMFWKNPSLFRDLEENKTISLYYSHWTVCKLVKIRFLIDMKPLNQPGNIGMLEVWGWSVTWEDNSLQLTYLKPPY